jgi:hypothetical protein
MTRTVMEDLDNIEIYISWVKLIGAAVFFAAMAWAPIGPGMWFPLIVGFWMAHDYIALRRVPDGPERRGE